MTAAMISASKLTLQRDRHQVLDSFSLAVHPKRIYQFTGANGCGKSTLLQALAGFLTPISGEIHYYGLNKTDIRFIGHTSGLWPQLSIEENCRLMLAIQGVIDDQSLSWALEYFDLNKNRQQKVSQCSRGQKQRTALCQLIMNPGRCWLLDEPWTGLDATNQVKLWQCIEAFIEKGGCVCLTSHHTIASTNHHMEEVSLECNNI